MPDNALWHYEYNLTDHVGNVRAVFAVNQQGTAELRQKTDYYPFGMVMNQTNTDTGPENKFLYNGKELQNDAIAGTKLDWYDYGARMYDAAIGRWHVVDPRSEELYFLTPYSYVANTPIIAIDPDGEFLFIVIPAIVGAVAKGALIGAVAGGVLEYGKQVVKNVREGGFNKDAFTNVDLKAIGGSATRGLISGAIVGATGGSSLIVSAAAQGAGGVVGGFADRAIKGESFFNAGEIFSDFVSGFIGGAVGSYVSTSLTGKATSTVITKHAVKLVPSAARAIGRAGGKQSKRFFPKAPSPPGVGTVRASDFNIDGVLSEDAIIKMIKDLDEVTIRPN